MSHDHLFEEHPEILANFFSAAKSNRYNYPKRVRKQSLKSNKCNYFNRSQIILKAIK